MEWQPIESVPTGQEVLVYGACNIPKDKCCGNHCHMIRVAECPRPGHPDLVRLNVTHWMPLPPPPQVQP
jgi:hypothetical protein